MIGYHEVIEGDGSVKIGRRFPMQAAANPPHNRRSITICITGNNTLESERWNVEQRSAAQRRIDLYRELFPWIQVVGHRDIGATATECPGVDVKEMFP